MRQFNYTNNSKPKDKKKRKSTFVDAKTYAARQQAIYNKKLLSRVACYLRLGDVVLSRIEIGERLIAHFSWSSLTPEKAVLKYLKEKPYIFVGNIDKNRLSEPQTNLHKYSHPLLGKPEYNEFYKSQEWRQLRYLALKNNGACCQCCGAKAGNGVQIHVDHIKPRSRYPELELCLDNLQVLCSDCNIGKGAWDDTDFR